MIYPNNLETKIGFSEIRQMLKERCLCSLGKEQVEKMTFSARREDVTEWLAQVSEFRKQVSEFRKLSSAEREMPMDYFLDPREAILRIRVENTHMEEEELYSTCAARWAPSRDLSPCCAKTMATATSPIPPWPGWQRE